MLTGIINRRIANRALFEADFMIKFVSPNNNKELVLANAVNISAGGMRFSIRKDTLLLNIGDKIDFIFQLPDSGDISVASEIRYRTIQDANPEVHYGVKFLNISLEDWNSIVNYCKNNSAALNSDSIISTNDAPPELPASSDIDTIGASVMFEDGTTFPVKVEDISFGGARINTDRLISVNTPVLLKIEDLNPKFEIKGYCIWSAPEKNNDTAFMAGIFFYQFDPEQFEQLRSLINTSHQKVRK
jgi:hypothetical protein